MWVSQCGAYASFGPLPLTAKARRAKSNVVQKRTRCTGSSVCRGSVHAAPRGRNALGRDRPFLEELCQCATGVAAARAHLLGRSLEHDAAATVAAFRAHVDDPVRFGDDVEVVLDHHYRVARVTRRCSTWISFSTSAMCRPTVGSSSTYNVFTPPALESSLTSLMRCASPPERVGLCWPSVRYPRPTSCRSFRQRWIDGCAAKNSSASSTFIASTSPTLLPRSLTVSVSALKRAPLHASQVTRTSGRKDIAIFFSPWPSHSSHRPPLVLNEKRLAVQPRMRASVVSAKSFLTWSQKPT